MNECVSTRKSTFGAVVLALALGCGGGGGGNDDVTVRGVGRIPDSAGGGVAANQGFAVNDLAAIAGPPLATGTTDADGAYEATIEGNRNIFVVINGARDQGNGVRVSGLMEPDEQSAKDFNGVTDIACEAGVTAVAEGALDAEDLDLERIANLEAGAATVAAGVDFTNPASVSAAAAEVRVITNDGANPPA